MGGEKLNYQVSRRAVAGKRIAGNWLRTSRWSRRQLQEARQQLLADPTISSREKEWLNQVSLEMGPDLMFIPWRARHYLSVGLSALRCIDACLEDSGIVLKPDPAILDLPCGFGRVLRFLQVRYPSATFCASEIDPEAIAFCQEVFGCSGVQSSYDFDKLYLNGPFDLVWCGSLLTHLSQDDAKGLLGLIFRHLSPLGTCVVSTHGQLSADRMSAGNDDYNLSEASRLEILSQLKETGYGYSGYVPGSRYGISIVSREQMLNLVSETGDWQVTSFIGHGWDAHQDVYAISRIRNLGHAPSGPS